MAENTGTTRTQRSANASKSTTRRSTNATKRSTAAKKAAQTRAARSGSTARKRTTRTAKSTARSTARTTQRTAARQTRQVENNVQTVAERVALTGAGVVLTARDNVVETVQDLRTTYGTRAKAERKLETQLRRFERRGETARRSLEREVKRTRTKLEREIRQRRNRFERQLDPVAKTASSQAGLVGAQVEYAGAQAQNIVWGGLTAGTQVAAKVQQRIASLV